jgi:hypothetical protein
MTDMRNLFRTWRIAAAVAALAAIAAGFTLTGGAAAAEAGAEAPQSLVEDFSYPDADRILAQHNVKLISGDGHIIMVDCATPAEGDIGLLKVRTTDEAIGPDGIGRVCFKILGSTGLLNLEVPGVYEIRGDGQKSGTGHQVTATVKPEDGESQVVQVDPDGSTQVGQGEDENNAPTTLLQLVVKGPL